MCGGRFFRVLLRTVIALNCLFSAATLVATGDECGDQGSAPLQPRQVSKPPVPKEIEGETLGQSSNVGSILDDSREMVAPLPKTEEGHGSRETMGSDDDDSASCEEVDAAANGVAAKAEETKQAVPEGLGAEISVVARERQDQRTTDARCPVREQGRSSPQVEASRQLTLVHRLPGELQVAILGHAKSLDSLSLMQQMLDDPVKDRELLSVMELETLRHGLDIKESAKKLMHARVDAIMAEVEKTNGEIEKRFALGRPLEELLEKLFTVFDGEENRVALEECCYVLFTDARLSDWIWQSYYHSIMPKAYGVDTDYTAVAKRLETIFTVAERVGSIERLKAIANMIRKSLVGIRDEIHAKSIAVSRGT